MVIAMMTLPTLPRVSAISATASRIGGIDIRPSMTRMMMPSAQRTHAGDEPDREAGERGQDRDREADGQRDARAVEHARVDVAAEHVGAEPVVGARARACACAVRARSGRRCRRYGASTAISSITISSAPPIAMVGMAAQEADDAAPQLDRRQEVGQRRRGGDARSARRWRAGGLNSGSSDRAACRAGRSPG